MKNKSFVDCFMLMGSALSLRGGKSLPEMGRPLIYEFLPTIVNLSLTVNEFEVMDFKNIQFALSGILNQRWIDQRLAANEETRKKAVAGQIWKPNIVNVNGKNKMSSNEHTVFWRGYGEEGNILLSEKIDTQFSCTMNLQNFPFDVQFCQLKFGSFRFPHDEVAIVWDKKSVEIMNTIETIEFRLINITTYISIDIRQSGNFSAAIVQFQLKRNGSHYILCVFVPCITMILLNYLALWLSINKRNKRFTLNIIAFLILLCFYYFSVCLNHPVPYLKALDIFISICGCFGIFFLSETLFIDSLCNLEELYKMKKQACLKEYSKHVQWLEFGMKLTIPVFYTFFVALYYAVYSLE